MAVARSIMRQKVIGGGGDQVAVVLYGTVRRGGGLGVVQRAGCKGVGQVRSRPLSPRRAASRLPWQRLRPEPAPASGPRLRLPGLTAPLAGQDQDHRVGGPDRAVLRAAGGWGQRAGVLAGRAGSAGGTRGQVAHWVGAGVGPSSGVLPLAGSRLGSRLCVSLPSVEPHSPHPPPSRTWSSRAPTPWSRWPTSTVSSSGEGRAGTSGARGLALAAAAGRWEPSRPSFYILPAQHPLPSPPRLAPGSKFEEAVGSAGEGGAAQALRQAMWLAKLLGGKDSVAKVGGEGCCCAALRYCCAVLCRVARVAPHRCRLMPLALPA